MTQMMDPPAAGPAQQNGNGGQLARRQYQPMEPVGSQLSLKNLLETQRDGIAMALPRHVTPDRLIKTMLVAANRIPDLVQCTQASVIETISRAAELGLDLSGTLGEAYPVPFNNKIKTADGDRWVKQCQLIIGYRGLAKLARQSGEIKRIDADVVCVHDTFTFRKGSDARCEFTPNLKGDRGDAVGAYAYVQFKDGGEQFDFMPAEDIEKVRRRSKSGSDRDGNAIGAWKTDWREMAKKTVFRRVAKWLPLSAEKFVAALEHEDAEYADVLEAQTHTTERGTTGLLKRLTSKPVSETQEFEAAPDAAEQVARQQVDTETGEVAPAPSESPEPDVSAVGDEPPAELDPKARWVMFLGELETLAREVKLEPDAFDRGLKHFVVAAKLKGREHMMSEKQREELRAAVRERRGNFA